MKISFLGEIPFKYSRPMCDLLNNTLSSVAHYGFLRLGRGRISCPQRFIKFQFIFMLSTRAWNMVEECFLILKCVGSNSIQQEMFWKIREDMFYFFLQLTTNFVNFWNLGWYGFKFNFFSVAICIKFNPTIHLI